MCGVVFMCRKHLIPAAGLFGFGVGIWTGLFFESSLVLLLVGAAAIGGALWLVKCN
jgi:hypothetical protein